MTAFLLGFAIAAGPVIAWQMRAAARRYDAHDHPSGPASPRPGSDGPNRCLRFVRVAGSNHVCLKPMPCNGRHVDDREHAT